MMPPFKVHHATVLILSCVLDVGMVNNTTRTGHHSGSTVYLKEKKIEVPTRLSVC